MTSDIVEDVLSGIACPDDCNKVWRPGATRYNACGGISAEFPAPRVEVLQQSSCISYIDRSRSPGEHIGLVRWRCTRPLRHTGMHHSHGTDGSCLHRWRRHSKPLRKGRPPAAGALVYGSGPHNL